MSLRCKNVLRTLAPMVCLAGCLAAAGCHPWVDSAAALLPPQRADGAGRARGGPSDPAAAAAEADRAVLACSVEKDPTGQNRSVWIRTLSDSPAGLRWRYPHLEELLARPPEHRPDLGLYLADEDPIVAANAAIALAQAGDDRGADRLTAAIRRPELPLPMRCAAVEALARLPAAAAVGPLRELADQYGRRGEETRSPYIAELHAEMIRGLARHVDAADDPRFRAALRSPAAEVRLESLAAWAQSTRGPLPVEATDLRTNGDWRVRAAALSAMAKRRHPQALECATSALGDTELPVRVAAIAALGELGGTAAQATLQGLLEKGHPERIRAESVAALARLGAKRPVIEAARDESWRVRMKVAEALAAWPDREGLSAAERFLDDPSLEVQRAVIATMVHWPLERAGPILLQAIGSSGFATRKKAAEELAARWPPAAEFPVEGPPARRADMLGQLQQRFQQQFALADQSAQAALAGSRRAGRVSPELLARVEQLVQRQDVQGLAGLGPDLLPALEQLTFDRQQPLPEAVWRDALSRCGPAFAAVEQINSADLSQRRRAADQLATLSQRQPLDRLALARLGSLMAAEQDQLVWRSVLTAVAAEENEPAAQLAYAAISHPSSEVRRRACEHLAAHGEPRHAKVLLPALDDPSQPVVCAAIRALGAIGRLENTGPLRRLAAASNEQVRLEAAIALVRLGDRSGPAALERMSYSSDPLVQRQVAQAMGQFPEPSYTAALIRLLDAHVSVRRAALESLPKVVGNDVAEADGPAPQDTSERIRRWKQWYQTRDIGRAYGNRRA